MAKQNFSELFSDLKEMVSNTEANIPTQRVVPIEKKASKRKGIDPELDEPFTFWTSKEKIKKLKIMSAEQGRSIKDLINSALDNYIIK